MIQGCSEVRGNMLFGLFSLYEACFLFDACFTGTVVEAYLAWNLCIILGHCESLPGQICAVYRTEVSQLSDRQQG